MLLEIIVDKTFDLISERVKTILKDKDYKFEPKKSDLQESLSAHYDSVISWMNFINFRDLRIPRALNSVYIDLQIQLTPRKWLPKDNSKVMLKIDEIVKRDFHIVILGDVGSGKTTTLQYICKRTIESEDDGFTENSFPILIRLRNLEKNESLFENIRRILGIHILFKGPIIDSMQERQKQSYEANTLTRRLIFNYLNELQPIILIDGFDEISIERQRQIYSELNELYQNLNFAKVILTCRSGAFEITLPNSEVFEICSLDALQIEKFVLNWLDDDKYETTTFLNQLKSSPFSDTAIRPLTLSYLCALYKKYKKIPNQPKSVYKRVVNLLLEDWDIQRGIARHSSFSDFEMDKKLEFLYCLAYEITLLTGEKVFSEELLLSIFDKIHSNFAISKIERRKVIKEIEADTGLIVQTSYDSFEFAHASIQEYLTAEYIVRLPKVYSYDIYTKNLMNELAIAICLSSNPTLYFASLVIETFPKSDLDSNKISTFLRRLILESPDFSSDPLTAIGILSFFTNYFTIKYKGINQPSDDIEVFERFWDVMVAKPKVEESILKVKELYYVINKKDGLVTLEYDIGHAKTGFDYPKHLMIIDKLYDI
jgi:GTPase SAR1 family protein